MAEDFHSSDNKESVSLCKRVMEFYDAVVRTAPNASQGKYRLNPYIYPGGHGKC
jgi:hypothetical protein